MDARSYATADAYRAFYAAPPQSRPEPLGEMREGWERVEHLEGVWAAAATRP